MTKTDQAALLEPGDLLSGRWEVLEHIATGGKGEVYRARQPKLEREVAVKVVSKELIDAYAGDQEEIEAELARFRREVLAMAATRHVNVLQVYDFDQAVISRGGRPETVDYLVMEYIPGRTLSATIPAGGLAGDEAVLKDWINKYFLPVLDGVEHIHAQDIVHRDLKPSNVMLDGEVPKISDFGLVGGGGGHWQPVTRSHHVIGTLAYMAPEQYTDLSEAGFRADIYSLGKMLYRAAVGEFDKLTMKPLQTASLPQAGTLFLKALDRVIQKATAQDPDQRYTSAGELRQALLRLPGLRPPTGVGWRKMAWALGLSAVLAVLLAGGVWYHFNMPPAAPPAAPPAETIARPAEPAASFKSPDGATLRLIPEGTVEVAEGRVMRVAPFYLSETKVTNFQYVEFLNTQLDRVVVEQGVAGPEGEHWLRLAELRQGVEPIAFQEGRFRITDPKYASHPVLLVSGHGAQAFAGHYGLRLPTSLEVLRAGWGEKPAESAPEAPAGQGMAAMHAQMPESATAGDKETYWPVTHWPPNTLGIRGLHAGLGEWVQSGDDGLSVLGQPENNGVSPIQPRSIWETFTWVGFRLAANSAGVP